MQNLEENEQAPATTTAPVTIITENRNLKAQSFIPGDDQLTTGKIWDEWLEEIEREFWFFRITDPMDKKDALLIYGGKVISRLEKSLPNPMGELNEYEKLKRKLNDYFTPKKNKHYARYLFLKMKQTHGETTTMYAARLRVKANESKKSILVNTVDRRELIQQEKNCPAYGKKCSKCKRFDHFAAVCRAGSRNKNHKPKSKQPKNKEWKKHLKKATKESASDNPTSSDDEFFCQAVRHLKQVKRIKAEEQDKTITIQIEDVSVKMEPDSGAEINVMDEHQFKALIHRASTNLTLTPSKTKLNTLQRELPVKGEFTVTIRNKTRGARARFVVVKGRINSPPLISKDTLQELGLLQIRRDGSFAEINDLRIHEEAPDVKTVKRESPNPEIKKITEKFAHIFQGIGKIRDKKNDQDFYA
ncbi:PREDICTED: uncharacterized protein LOC107341222 [Acropora digitifera]|uniref:uncharacterized protein LOC107341222 n=1 Tax=Acropora digitifera TaxID=70779 RepID=UPI00077B041B|nr:PREDICTED: uncharacterized protein LOC107341222 [Acropora digitifera]